VSQHEEVIMRRIRTKFLFLPISIIMASFATASAEEPKSLSPTIIDLNSSPCGDGWKRWDSIGRIEGMFRERITALVANDGDVWVGMGPTVKWGALSAV
jgi:hypothetical protein